MADDEFKLVAKPVDEVTGPLREVTSVRCAAAIFSESEIDRTSSRTSRKPRSWP